MNSNNSKMADILIYFLMICLVILISYNIYLLTQSGEHRKMPHKNSIEVFPNEK